MLRYFILISMLTATSWGWAASPTSRAEVEFFEKRIRPALIQYCYECHATDADDVGGGLLLDSRNGWLQGGENGPAIVPGDPANSLVFKAIEYRDGLEMPPDRRLPESVVSDFRRWIKRGAVDPRRSDAPDPKPSDEDEPVEALWSLQPLHVTAPPPVTDTSWPRSNLDQYVLARLESAGLHPVGDADPATLLRRVTFDLTGLPPEPNQVDAFLAEPSEAHYRRIVDRLLASPQYAARWGRHWLDVARYGESAGSSRDVLMIYAWRYRDFVINAFNADMPFDRFVTLQVAGDLLPAATDEQRYQQQVATGLLAIGSKSLNGGNLTYDVIDDQIDVVSKSVLGLTVACARCHDHKFDPIPTSDYYALAGIFLSTDTRYGGSIRRPKNEKERRGAYLALNPHADQATVQREAQLRARVEQLEKQVNTLKKRSDALAKKVAKPYRTDPDQVDLDALDDETKKAITKYRDALNAYNLRRDELQSARKQLPPEPEYAIGVQEARKITDANILIRGEKGQPGERVSRGFLTCLEGRIPAEDIPPIDEKESGRRQLATWLVHPDNPLTPRVAVNRIWQHLMGRGIVETVDNFGSSGQLPSHPDLLDHLAGRFVHHHRWSIKGMVREIVLSRTYRLSSQFDPSAFAIDPENRLRWRMSRRRLEAEALRDAMLHASGDLEIDPFPQSLVARIGEGEVGRNLNTRPLEEPFFHRSVYLPIIRGIIPEPLKLFDFPEPSNVQGARDSNTTAKQSLYLMNSPFAVDAARRFARRLLVDSSYADDAQRIDAVYMACFGRHPESYQFERDLGFLEQMQRVGPGSVSERRERAWTAYCQSLMSSAPFRFLD